MRVVALFLALLTSDSPAQNGYVWPQSAAPGETVDVFASSSTNYQVTVYRSHYFGQESSVLVSPQIQGIVQARQVGSYAHGPTHSDLEITGPLSLEAWVRPLTSGNGNWQGILSKYSNPGETAYGIYLMPNGQLSFYLGATGVFSASNRLLTTSPIPTGLWTHVVATWDGTTKRIYLDGSLDVTSPFAGPIHDTSEPVRVASFGSSGAASQFFDGQIDSPAIYDRVLTRAEIEQRTAELADYDATSPGVLAGCVAQWNFGEREGSVLGDASGSGHDLTLVNYGARGVAGPSPRTQPQESHSIRFARTEEINTPWASDWSFVIPPSWESGFYVVAIGAQRVPLIVKPAPSQERRVAVLANTNTWHAYNTWTGAGALYTTHPGGDIVYYAGMRQPNPAVVPKTSLPAGKQHLVDAERFLYRWMDDNNYPFDLYSDLDLHEDPSLLASYDVLILNAHSEYWTHRMVDHVEAFQDAGGSLVNLSGNTMWSLVTYDTTLSVMEGRKHPHGSGTIPASERWHSQDGEPLGGTLRCIGRPEHEVIGTGYGIGGGSASGWAKVLEPNHWVFKNTGVTAGQTFGTTGLNGGAMMGFEVDVVDAQWTPANAEILAIGQYPSPTFWLDISDCQTRNSWNVTQGGEIIYYDHPGGGGVFGIPSVTVGGSLIVDAVAAQMLRNVLNRFLGEPWSYCTPGSSATGCQAHIAASGMPSATASAGFTLAAVDVEGQKAGMFFFGTNGRQANPWGSGTSVQCVIPPVVRAGLLPSSGTVGLCNGLMTQDLNARWTSKPAQNPGPGATVQAQFWYRDPLNTSNQTTSLSDALEFVVGP